MPYAILVYILQPRRDLEFPFRKVDLPKDSSEKCKKRVFEAVSMVEVIKHLQNPRHTLRQIKSLLKDKGIIFLSPCRCVVFVFVAKVLFCR